ncbi:MAG: hypothetical protein C0473_01720 [Cyanobacteria bacterium DS3.002]|nr:hypothetical protein [Cyanobacteria bacterium DS3.002]MBA4049548.1 hypothetical protein [Cyanobacteria bacterium DS2.008]
MTHTKRKRTSNGISLTELLMSILLLGFSLAIIGELAVVSTIGTIRTTNKTDGLAAARAAIDRISSDVRQARAFGDYYAKSSERLSFPSTTNPLYATGAPLGGWPNPPWQTIPMVMSDTCLILQLPVVYLDPQNDPTNSLYNPAAAENPRNGFPVMLPKSYTISSQNDLENLDTVIYQVVPDPARPNEFLIQVARYPGAKLSTLNIAYKPLINPPQTILKGLVGPRPLGSADSVLPSVFSYLGRNAITNHPTNGKISKVALSTTTLPTVLGITIDMDIKKAGITTTAGDGKDPQYFGIHNEVFMRSNRNLILNNFGP